MAATSEYPCPQCHQGLLLDEDTAGRKVKCPYCKTQVQMPYQEAPVVTQKIQPRLAKGKRSRNNAQKSAPYGKPASAAPVPETPSLFTEDTPAENVVLPVESAAPAGVPVVPDKSSAGENLPLPAAEAVAEDPKTEEPAPTPKQTFPLHNSRPLLEPPPGIEHHGALPEKEKSPDEELKRLAAMAGNVEYDLEKFEKKGMISFGCPMCHRPLRVAKKDSGTTILCEGCGLDIVAPKPELGIPAQLLDIAQANAGPSLPKAVLPTARKIDDQSLAEGRAGGRAKKNTVEQAALTEPAAPSTPANLSAPAPGSIPEKLSKPGRPELKIQPVPARSDTVMGGNAITLPSERISQARTVGATKATIPAPAAEVVDVPESIPDAKTEAKPKPRGAMRLNNERRVFAPQKEMEGDLEISESWGRADEKPPVSKRYVIIAWLVMVPILLGLGLWFMKETFRKKVDAPPSKSSETKDEARVVHVAEDILKKFFASKTVEEMSKYVRHPEDTLPRMESHYKRPLPRFTVESFSGAKVGNMEGADFLTGTLILSGEQPHSIAFELPPENSPNPDDLKLDWESLVYWSDMPWDQFLATESEKGIDFRVVMQKDDYPNEPYTDQDRWVCFKLYHPGSFGKDFGYCYGYVEQDSAAYTAMIQPMRRAGELGQQSLNAIVRLRFRPESRGRKNFVPQVSIERFTPGWLIP